MSAPAIMGRFNYQAFRKDLFNVIFVPYNSEVQIVIARNLTMEEKNEMVQKLNDVLYTARANFFDENAEGGAE